MKVDTFELLLCFLYSKRTCLKGNQHLTLIEDFQEVFLPNVLRREQKKAVYKTNMEME